MAIKSTAHLGRKAIVKQELIKNIVRDKVVIHYGCVDDDEALVKSKDRHGYYLHRLVTESAKDVIGVDINRKAFKFLNKDLGFNNVVYGDVEDPSTFQLDRKFLKRVEVVLIPDLIEHLNNPGMMLDGIRKYYSRSAKIIILTPNPTAWYYFVASLLNKEIYSPYHTMSFTTENMIVLLGHYGIRVDRVVPGLLPKERNRFVRIIDRIGSKLAILISPSFADFYLYECSFQDT